MKIFNYKLGKNRGHARVWIEGMRLAKFGFNRYDRINVQYDDKNSVIRITKDPESDHIVAGRSRNGKDLPIIDLNNQAVTKIMRLSSGQYSVNFMQNKLLIRPVLDNS